jgi:ankyrin repeat protein
MRFVGFLGCFLLLAAPAVAREKRNPDGSDSILKALAKIFKDNRTLEQIKKDNALIRATAKGELDGIRAALKKGALINSRYLDEYAFLDKGQSGYTALMLAVRNQQTKAIKLLIQKKADLEIKHPGGYTALYLAVVRNQKETIGLLVKAGAKQDPAKIRLSVDLIRAACKGFKSGPHEPFPPYPGSFRTDRKTPDIATVVKKGADINMRNPKGYTALMYAANLGLVENVKTLLAMGADVRLKSADGETALSLAEREEPLFKPEQRRQVVKLLKKHLAKKR